MEKMEKKSRLQVICRKYLTLNKVTYLEKDKIYLLEDNYDKTYNVSEETETLCFNINADLLDEYFIGLAEYRNIQIDSILE